MSGTKTKGRWHPSRTSGIQKQTRARDANKAIEEKKKKKRGSWYGSVKELLIH